MRFKGEIQALESAIVGGSEFGYGNLIDSLKWAWAISLVAGGLDTVTAIKHAGINLDAYIEPDPEKLLQGMRSEICSYGPSVTAVMRQLPATPTQASEESEGVK